MAARMHQRDATRSELSEASGRGPRPRLVAIVAAYNEDKYIASVVLKTRRFVDEVLVVDDGSDDLTGFVASQAGATVLTHPVNRGKGAAVRDGLRWAVEIGAEGAVLLDGDGQHRPSDIERLIAPVQAGQADMVVGSRFIGEEARKNIPGWRVFGQRALNAATTIGSGHGLSDSQSGFRALSRAAVRVFAERLTAEGFTVESEMQFIARECELRTAEMPIVADYHAPSKRSPVAHGLQVINGILKLVGQARPLLFISVPGLVALTLGLLLGALVVRIYSETLVLAVGYSMITVLLVLVGVLAIFTGIVLHTMRAYFLEIGRRE